MRYGEVHKVNGMFDSTVLADMDFETYSESGMYFDPIEMKWKSPKYTGKKGISVVGTQVYAEHPSTEVLVLKYNLKDGMGVYEWLHGDPPPTKLFDHIAEGKLIEAWNVMFEERIWNEVCVKKYGWPVLPTSQLRCAMAKSRAYCYPGALGKAAAAAGLPSDKQKDKDGTRLLNKFSTPRNPTKDDKSLRIVPDFLTDEDSKKLAAYCEQDVIVEHEMSTRCPDLSGMELAYWLIDQECNREGVRLDTDAIDKALAILDEEYAEAAKEMSALTHGKIDTFTQVQRIKTWLWTKDVKVGSVDADTVDYLLTRDNLPDDVRRVLELRSAYGSAAVKKLYAMKLQQSKEGRATNMFVYHSARTGRDAGAGIQPQNMPNSGPDVVQCPQCQAYSTYRDFCRGCSAVSVRMAQPQEWSPEAADFAIDKLKEGTLKYYFPSITEVLSGCLRGLFIADEGHDFIGSDYSSIEAVVAACLTGCQWRINTFHNGGDIYLASISQITNTPIAEYERYKQENGQHHADRKKGKVAELACFTHHTQVLTSCGYKSIVDVNENDLLWDGVEWVKSEGVAYKGKRKTIKVDGVQMTPTHPIFMNGSWKAASELASNVNTLCQALEIAKENLPFGGLSMAQAGALKKCSYLVPVMPTARTVWTHTTYLKGRLLVAICVLRKKLIERLNITGRTRTLSQIKNIVEDFLIGLLPRSVDVTAPQTEATLIMAGVGYALPTSGELKRTAAKRVSVGFLNTLSHLKGGMSQTKRWTGSTLIKGMSREILGLLRGLKTCLINVACETCKEESFFSKSVYDIVNAGPRNRFTIKTKSGHLIVHNSGYGGWVGAWKQFNADDFFNSEEELVAAIKAWRNASPEIVDAWGGQHRWRNGTKIPELYGLEGGFIQACQNEGTYVEALPNVNLLGWGGKVYMFLPSGRFITYHDVELRPNFDRPGQIQISFMGYNSNPKMGSIGWTRMTTYGGKLFENLVQATARDIMAYAAVNLHNNGYKIKLRVHDELITQVPEGWGSVEEMERIGGTLPPFATDWPVKMAGGWKGKRFRK